MKLNEFVKKYGNREIKDVNKLKDLLVNKKKKWKPEINDNYYFVDTTGISCSLWNNYCIDKYRYDYLRLFKTEKEADRYREIQMACRKSSFEPDWEDHKQEKYHFVYRYDTNHLQINDYYVFETGCPFYFESKKIAQSLIDKFGEKDIAKYVLGVEI